MTTTLHELYEVYPPDPRATKPYGVRVDDTLFGSVTAADPVTGAVGGDLEPQLQTAVAAIEHLLHRGGMAWGDLQRVEAYTSEGSMAELASLLDQTLGPRTRIPRFFAQPAVLRGGQRLRLDVIAAKGDARPEVRHIRLSATEAPVAARIGPLFFAYDVSPLDPATGRVEFADTASQVATAFDNLDRALKAASMDQSQLLRIAGYFRDLGEKDLLNNRMVLTFYDPSQKPVHKYVPAVLPSGISFSLQALGLMTDDRQIIEIEGIRHNDPISLGALAGNVFVSSRVQGRLEAGPREQADRLIDAHARRLTEHLGGRLEDVTQAVWGIGDPAFDAPVRDACSQHWQPGAPPRIDILQADFPHSPLPRLEFIALLKRP